MDEEIDGDIIKATQLSLGKFVKRPPLTEKLLKKPPFRFLHDVFTAVLKTTGFFKGLFEEEELISDNVKDRESKITFLNKVITVLGLATGQTLTAKPSKIVAGQEPIKTNELLQCLGHALEKKISSDEAVKKYKESKKSSSLQDKKSKDGSKSKESKLKKVQDAKKSSEKVKDSDKELSNRNEKKNSKAQVREYTTLKGESIHKKVPSTISLKKNENIYQNIQKKTNLHEKDKQENVQNLSKGNELEGKPDNCKIEDIAITEKNQKSIENNAATPVDNIDVADVTKDIDEKGKNGFEENINLNNSIPDKAVSDNILVEKDDLEKRNEDVHNLENNAPGPEKGKIQETKPINNVTQCNHVTNAESSISLESHNTKVVDKRPQSVRPSSSRPGAPRIKDKHDAALSHETPIVHKVNIIAENTVTEEDEENTIVVVDNETDSMRQNEEIMHLSSDQHGHLVQQILDSQKEFSQVSGKTEIEWQFGVQKARDAVNQEIEQMRFNIQALSRISNPLGKLIDHIQEDVEVMRQELQEWTKKYEETSEELSKQKIANVEFLQPLQAKIKQLDADIEDKRDKINDLRIVVFKNYYRIEKFLASGNVQ